MNLPNLWTPTGLSNTRLNDSRVNRAEYGGMWSLAIKWAGSGMAATREGVRRFSCSEGRTGSLRLVGWISSAVSESSDATDVVAEGSETKVVLDVERAWMLKPGLLRLAASAATAMSLLDLRLRSLNQLLGASEAVCDAIVVESGCGVVVGAVGW
jgi:hypothetical protein